MNFKDLQYKYDLGHVFSRAEIKFLLESTSAQKPLDYFCLFAQANRWFFYRIHDTREGFSSYVFFDRNRVDFEYSLQHDKVSGMESLPYGGRYVSNIMHNYSLEFVNEKLKLIGVPPYKRVKQEDET